MRFSTHSCLRLGIMAAALAVASIAHAQTSSSFSITFSPQHMSAQDNKLASDPAGSTLSINNRFDIKKYNGPNILTGASFSATLTNTELINYTDISSAKATASHGLDVMLGGTTVSGNATSALIIPSSSSSIISLVDRTTTGTVSTDKLDTLAGSGTASVLVTSTLNANRITGTGIFKVTDVTSTGQLTYTYNTTPHAWGSFAQGSNVLNLDFGSIASGVPMAQNFDLYNALGSYGLQVVSVTQVSEDNIFHLSGLDSITNLTGGSSAQGTMSMDAQTVAGTSYWGQWTIIVADSAIGDGELKRLNQTNELTLTAAVSVLAPDDTVTTMLEPTVTAVPEPETYALMLAGLGAIGFMSRRRAA